MARISEAFYLENFPDQPLPKVLNASPVKLWQRFVIGMAITEVFDSSRKKEVQRNDALLQAFKRHGESLHLHFPNMIPIIPQGQTFYQYLLRVAFSNPNKQVTGEYLFETAWADLSREIKSRFIPTYQK